MKLKLYQIDAFTEKIFQGNPAAVCPLESWPDDDLLQKIAAENNLSETAFFVKRDDCYDLRWFTPATEVALCGHATLATAWVLFNEYTITESPVLFRTKSGELRVSQEDDRYVLDFPVQRPVPCDPPASLLPSLGIESASVYQAEDYLVVLETEKEIRDLSPDVTGLKGLPLRGVIVTAPGDSTDFVSRWFGPNVGVNEDPVTGSAHTTLTPYWSERLNKSELTALQLSERSGELWCSMKNDRVFIKGAAVKFMEGHIFLE